MNKQTEMVPHICNSNAQKAETKGTSSLQNVVSKKLQNQKQNL